MCDELLQTKLTETTRPGQRIGSIFRMPTDVADDQTDGRTTRWDSHKAHRRDLILDAAMLVIDQVGPDAGVNDIAERAGLPRSVVYRIFKDRGDLDEQLRTRIVERLMQDLRPALALEGAIGDAIDRVVGTYVGWIVKFPHLHQFLGTGSPKQRTAGSRVVTGTRTAIAVELSGVFEDVLRKQERTTELAEPLAFGLVGLMDASVNRWLSKSQSKITAEQMSDFLALSIRQLIEVNLRTLGVDLDPETELTDLL